MSKIEHTEGFHHDADGDPNAAARFFPAWWMHTETDSEPRPLFTVISSDHAELEQARAVQPDVIDARYFLKNANGELVDYVPSGS